MKTTILFLLCALTVAAQTESTGQNWRIVTTSEKWLVYFKPESVTQPRSGVVRSWFKFVPTKGEEGRKWKEQMAKMAYDQILIQKIVVWDKFGIKHRPFTLEEKSEAEEKSKTFGYRMSLEEFNCAEQSVHMVQYAYSAEDGDTIVTEDPLDDSWIYILPDTVGEARLQAVCAAAKRLDTPKRPAPPRKNRQGRKEMKE